MGRTEAKSGQAAKRPMAATFAARSYACRRTAGRDQMGCGPGWTRGPYGHCHPMGYGVAVVPGPYYGFHPYAHPYAYGHCWIGPYGHRHCN
jgi:hypothetical protein